MANVDYQEQKHYWEGIGSRRDPDHPVVRAFSEPKLELIEEALPPGPLTMLEVGAGNGYFSHTFRRAFELTCLDFSPNMLEMNPLPSNQKVVGDAEKLPFEDDAFDVVFCGNLLHHLTDPTIAVREMRRVARRHVVLLEPNAINPLMFAFGVLKREERGSLKFTPAYLKSLGRKAGMELRRFATHGSVVPNKTPTPLLPILRVVDYPNPLGFYNIAIFDI
jgi:SAM-dependent methyltransferase